MTAILSFTDNLLARALELERRGLLAKACRALQRLLHIRPLTRKMRGEAAGRLGKLQIQRGQFARARRNLTLAAARLPHNTDYQNMLAKAIEQDDTAIFDQAGQHYRACVDLQPDNPFYRIDLARHLARREQRDAHEVGERSAHEVSERAAHEVSETDEAMALLHRAAELGADDVEVVGVVAQELRDMGRWDEAQAMLRRARFRHARNPPFQQLWNDQQFQALWARQRASAANLAGDFRRILRFVPKMTHPAAAASGQ